MNNPNQLNSIPFSNEIRLILTLIKDGSDSELKEWLEKDIDWDLFIQLVRHHRIYPNIYHKLKALESDRVPQKVLMEVYKDYKKNTFQMLYLSGEMEQLARRFDENEIKAIFLKGPVLADDLYGDVSLRTSSDLDILVPIKDLEKIEQFLTINGYVKDDYIHTILNDWKWRHHHVAYYNPYKKIKLEIHWRLNPGPAKEPSFNELWERKRISGLTLTPVFILSKEDLFLFLVLHGARHGWSRLRWLLDIKQIITQAPDWINNQKLLKKFQCLHIAGQGINLASKLLDAPISKEMATLANKKRSQRLAQDAMFYIKRMVNLHSLPLPKDVAEFHSHHLFSLMPLRQRILFILSFLFPYSVDAEALPLPRPLHFLYFPLRPFLWAWRKNRGVVPEEVKR